MRCPMYRECGYGVCVGEYVGHCGHWQEPIKPTDNSLTKKCPHGVDSGKHFQAVQLNMEDWEVTE